MNDPLLSVIEDVSDVAVGFGADRIENSGLSSSVIVFIPVAMAVFFILAAVIHWS